MSEEGDSSSPVEGYEQGHVQHLVKGQAEPAIAALERAVANIPVRHQTGRMDDRTRELFRVKEQAEKRVARVMDELRTYIPIVQAEMTRCQKRMWQIDKAMAGVHDAATREQLRQAKEIVSQNWGKAAEQLRLAEKTIEEIHRMLAYSTKVKLPKTDEK